MSMPTLITDEHFLSQKWIRVELPVPSKPRVVSLAEIREGDQIRPFVPLWRPKKRDGLATPPGYAQVSYIPYGRLPPHIISDST